MASLPALASLFIFLLSSLTPLYYVRVGLVCLPLAENAAILKAASSVLAAIPFAIFLLLNSVADGDISWLYSPTVFVRTNKYGLVE